MFRIENITPEERLLANEALFRQTFAEISPRCLDCPSFNHQIAVAAMTIATNKKRSERTLLEMVRAERAAREYYPEHADGCSIEATADARWKRDYPPSKAQ